MNVDDGVAGREPSSLSCRSEEGCQEGRRSADSRTNTLRYESVQWVTHKIGYSAVAIRRLPSTRAAPDGDPPSRYAPTGRGAAGE
jgi:hypothetical protein